MKHDLCPDRLVSFYGLDFPKDSIGSPHLSRYLLDFAMFFHPTRVCVRAPRNIPQSFRRRFLCGFLPAARIRGAGARGRCGRARYRITRTNNACAVMSERERERERERQRERECEEGERGGGAIISRTKTSSAVCAQTHQSSFSTAIL